MLASLTFTDTRKKCCQSATNAISVSKSAEIEKITYCLPFCNTGQCARCCCTGTAQSESTGYSRSGDSTSTKAGTLEYFVKRKGVVGILSNAHVTKGVGRLLFQPIRMVVIPKIYWYCQKNCCNNGCRLWLRSTPRKV